jgi:hypothetical protein
MGNQLMARHRSLGSKQLLDILKAPLDIYLVQTKLFITAAVLLDNDGSKMGQEPIDVIGGEQVLS